MRFGHWAACRLCKIKKGGPTIFFKYLCIYYLAPLVLVNVSPQENVPPLSISNSTFPTTGSGQSATDFTNMNAKVVKKIHKFLQIK